MMVGRRRSFLAIIAIAVGLLVLVVLSLYQPTTRVNPSPPLTTSTGYSPAPAGFGLYVAPIGSSNSSCTQAAPCAFDRANAIVKPGQTVHVSPGSYTAPITLSTSGTSGSPIIWVSDTKWGARITSTNAAIVVLVSGAYVNFQDFDVSGNTNAEDLIYLHGQHTQATGNYVHDSPHGCSPNGGIYVDSQGSQVIGNFVKNIGDTSLPRDMSCRLYHGIYLSGQNILVANNLVTNSLADGISSWHNSSNDAYINNTSINNGGIGLLVGSGDTNALPSGNQGSVVENNIVVDNQEGIVEEGNTGTASYKHNLTYGNKAGDAIQHSDSSTETGTIHADPQFVNPARSDFRLKSTSPAIKAGSSTNAPATDKNGTAKRGPVNIGAY
jgi:Right handed beta helix region